MSSDRDILRGLAARCREHAESAGQARLREDWRRLNDLEGTDRPLVLTKPEGAWSEILTDADVQCQDAEAREIERNLRIRLYHAEVLRDDRPFPAAYDIGWSVSQDGFGVEVPQHRSSERGAASWDPPITDLERDMPKLRHRNWRVDRAASARRLETAAEAFGDLLPVRRRHFPWWTLGLTIEIIQLVGIERLMTLMCDDPDGLHRLMAWMRDEHQAMIDWHCREGLLTPNHDAVWNYGSGGVADTGQLQAPVAGSAVGPQHLWGFSESQETVGVSPRMFREFILPYQKPLLEQFGLAYYGCCEGLDKRIDDVLTIRNLRVVSVSPWCDQRRLAEKVGQRCVLARKPNPTLVASAFDEGAIRADLRTTLDQTRGCHLFFVLKDTHTISHEPWRLARWVELAREEIDAFATRSAPPTMARACPG
ncbi:MAG TPA: hypothetical protein DCS97_05915 [Planctomycetes bacterium]|nr:hypothetical protein [Planctomycetota bacterium]